MVEKSGLLSEPSEICAPAVSAPFYPYQFWHAVFPILVKSQDLRYEMPLRFITTYTSDRNRRAQWRAALHDIGAESSDKSTAFTASATFCLFRALRQIGGNIKNFRHYSSKLEICNETLFLNLLAPTSDLLQEARIEIEIEGAFAAGPSKAAIISECLLYSSKGDFVARQSDVWLVLGVADDQLARLPKLNGIEIKRGLSKKTARITGAAISTLCLSRRAPKRFGRASGDLNPVHTGGPVASLLGYRKPFMQGFGTMNVILAELDKRYDVGSIEMVFCRPFFVEETVELRVQGPEFELVGASERLVSCGRYSPTTA